MHPEAERVAMREEMLRHGESLDALPLYVNLLVLRRDRGVDDGDRDVWLAATPCSFGIQGPLLLGDSNFDGTVDSIDLNVLALNWLQDESHDWTEGNFTGAGVNAADLNALALNWQRSINETATVPEAGSLTLTTTLALALAAYYRRRSS